MLLIIILHSWESLKILEMRVPSGDGVYYRIIGNVPLLDRRTSPQDRVEPMIFVFADISRIVFWYLGGDWCLFKSKASYNWGYVERLGFNLEDRNIFSIIFTLG